MADHTLNKNGCFLCGTVYVGPDLNSLWAISTSNHNLRNRYQYDKCFMQKGRGFKKWSLTSFSGCELMRNKWYTLHVFFAPFVFCRLYYAILFPPLRSTEWWQHQKWGQGGANVCSKRQLRTAWKGGEVFTFCEPGLVFHHSTIYCHDKLLLYCQILDSCFLIGAVQLCLLHTVAGEEFTEVVFCCWGTLMLFLDIALTQSDYLSVICIAALFCKWLQIFLCKSSYSLFIASIRKQAIVHWPSVYLQCLNISLKERGTLKWNANNPIPKV